MADGQSARPDDDDDLKSRIRTMAAGRAPLITLGALLVFLILTYAVVLWVQRPRSPGEELRLDQLFEEIGAGNVPGVTFLVEDSRFVGTTEDGRQFWVGTSQNESLVANLVGDLQEQGIELRVDTQPGKRLLGTATALALPAATLIVGMGFLFLFFARPRGAGGDLGSGIGKSKARRYGGGDEAVTFADVAGIEEAIEELREVKDFLASPAVYEAVGARPPRGILLMGPPGCGKTLLARAVAGEAGVPFFSVSASEFTEILVGVGPSRVRDLFRQAGEAAPSIIFIDELDAVGRARSGPEGMNAEAESTLNELLVQLDGFDTAGRVVLMAATNRPDVLDQALIRKGRFDRQVVIDAPDFAGRLAIAKIHARGKPLGRDADLESLARRTVGFTGADMAAALNEAATLAARRRMSTIGARELAEAVERVVAGPERHSRLLGPDDKERIAVHESGHVLLGWVFSSTISVEKVSIVARGHSLGGTWSLALDDRAVRTRSQMEEELTAALAGRAAENLVFGDPSGAAAVDLRRATQLATQMVYELGMSDMVGPMAVGPLAGQQAGFERSPEISADAGREVRRLLAEADERARVVLTAHRAHLDELVGLLIARETLERPDIEQILGGLPLGLPTLTKPRSRSAGSRTPSRAGRSS